jgi:acyl carrier protein
MDSKQFPAGTPAGVRTLAEVKETLKALIEENAGIPAASINDASTIDGDLAMDSLSFVSLQVAVDETFGVECEAEELEKRNRFDAIAELVWERLQTEQPHSSPTSESSKPVRVIDGRRH